MKRRGRRTRLTPQLQRKICKLLERGHAVGTVCASLGLPDRTFHDYCARDSAFLAATQRARAQGRVRIVDSILDDRDWRGKAWYLERTAPAEFGRCAERELPPAESSEKRINVAFVLPSGEQISWAQARAMAQLPPANQAGDQYHEESTPFDGNHATEPNSEP
jgi:transposase